MNTKKALSIGVALFTLVMAGCASETADGDDTGDGSTEILGPAPAPIDGTTRPEMMSIGGNIWCYRGYCCPASDGCERLYTGSCYAAAGNAGGDTGGCYLTF
jgi:hypothetical protein